MHRVLLPALPALLMSACLLGPNQGEPLCGANASVHFYGYSTVPNNSIAIQAARSRNGTFTTIASVSSGSSAFNYAGYSLYYFSVHVVIPVWESQGSLLRSYVRARSVISGQTVYFSTFDESPPFGSDAASCIVNRVNAGNALPNATDICASNDSPVAELVVPALSTCPCANTSYTGNLVIDDALDAANYVCLVTLNGSLTVADTAPESVPLPSLTQITGDAELHYEHPTTANNVTMYHTRNIDLSALTTIGGDVALSGRTNDSPPTTPTGLHAVTSIGGDVDIRLWGANPNVLSGVTHLAGNLSIHGWTASTGNLDLFGGNTLKNLTGVDGDVSAAGFYHASNVFQNLTSVGGDLTLEAIGFHAGPSFQLLSSVGADLHFVAIKEWGGSWPALATVGGELGVLNHPNLSSLSGVLPIGAISAHALRLENNAALTTLNGTFHVGTGDIHIHQNPALSQCTVNSFLTAQSTAGWTGASFVSETIACP